MVVAMHAEVQSRHTGYIVADGTKASGWVLITSGPQGVAHTHTHTRCSVALQGGAGEAAVPLHNS